MTLFSRILSAFGLGGLANKEQGRQFSGPASRSTEANITVSDERAMAISAVWACVRILVQSGASLPLHVYRRTPEGREAIEDHPLCRLLKRRPNTLMNAREFRQAMWLQRVLWGNAYAYIERNSQGDPVSLIPLKPEYMDVERSNGRLTYKYAVEDRGVLEYRADQILHLRGFSPDGVIGLSPLSYARQTLGISVSADRYAARSFGGRPNAVMKIDRILTQEQRDQLRKLYTDMGNSSLGDGSWWLLEAGLDYQSISVPPDDLQMIESRQFQVPEICRFFGVPAVMVDGSAGATAAWPASYEQQVLAFLTFTLKPYLEEWESKVDESLVDDDQIYVEHSVEGLLRADSANRASFYSQMVQNGIMTRNEVRRRENMKPLPGGDELTIQVNMAPAESLGDDDATEI